MPEDQEPPLKRDAEDEADLRLALDLPAVFAEPIDVDDLVERFHHSVEQVRGDGTLASWVRVVQDWTTPTGSVAFKDVLGVEVSTPDLADRLAAMLGEAGAILLARHLRLVHVAARQFSVEALRAMGGPRFDSSPRLARDGRLDRPACALVLYAQQGRQVLMKLRALSRLDERQRSSYVIRWGRRGHPPNVATRLVPADGSPPRLASAEHGRIRWLWGGSLNGKHYWLLEERREAGGFAPDRPVEGREVLSGQRTEFSVVRVHGAEVRIAASNHKRVADLLRATLRSWYPALDVQLESTGPTTPGPAFRAFFGALLEGTVKDLTLVEVQLLDILDANQGVISVRHTAGSLRGLLDARGLSFVEHLPNTLVKMTLAWEAREPGLALDWRGEEVGVEIAHGALPESSEERLRACLKKYEVALISSKTGVKPPGGEKSAGLQEDRFVELYLRDQASIWSPTDTQHGWAKQWAQLGGLVTVQEKRGWRCAAPELGEDAAEERAADACGGFVGATGVSLGWKEAGADRQRDLAAHLLRCEPFGCERSIAHYATHRIETVLRVSVDRAEVAPWVRKQLARLYEGSLLRSGGGEGWRIRVGRDVVHVKVAWTVASLGTLRTSMHPTDPLVVVWPPVGVEPSGLDAHMVVVGLGGLAGEARRFKRAVSEAMAPRATPVGEDATATSPDGKAHVSFVRLPGKQHLRLRIGSMEPLDPGATSQTEVGWALAIKARSGPATFRTEEDVCKALGEDGALKRSLGPVQQALRRLAKTVNDFWREHHPDGEPEELIELRGASSYRWNPAVVVLDSLPSKWK